MQREGERKRVCEIVSEIKREREKRNLRKRKIKQYRG